MIEFQRYPFSAHRPSQPKREVCTYLAAQGFNIPRTFDNLDEARRSGAPFIIRSEHPQDLDGISGVRDSFVVQDRGIVQRYISEEMIKMICDERGATMLPAALIEKQAAILRQQFIESLMRNTTKHRKDDYCAMHGIDAHHFDEETTYSYWEYVPGVNRQMIADSAVDDRYHILSSGEKTMSYATVEGGELRVPFGWQAEEDLSPDCVRELIDTYESVRSTLDPDNCLLLEIQTAQKDARNFIVQVLYTRPFDPADFSIGSIPTGMAPADYVRGKTAKEGTRCHLRFFTAATVPQTPIDVEAAFDCHYREVLLGALLPQRTVHCMSDDHGLAWHLTKASARHFNAMQLFSPRATFVIPHSQILRDDELDKMSLNVDLALPVRFVIDGTRGYVERLGDLVESPIAGYEPTDKDFLEMVRRARTLKKNTSMPTPRPTARQMLLFEKDKGKELIAPSSPR